MFALLSFWDFAVIALLIIIFAGGSAATASMRLRPAERRRQARIESKLNAIAAHLGMTIEEEKESTWQRLADDPDQKIAAIKAYREEHGVGLAEAKQAVEDYIAGRGNSETP